MENNIWNNSSLLHFEIEEWDERITDCINYLILLKALVKEELMALYQKSFSNKTVDQIASLPHPTVQKFIVITVAIVRASRRFPAQITRHQNEVKFMSASLQYSNYSERAAFTIPYKIRDYEEKSVNVTFRCDLL